MPKSSLERLDRQCGPAVRERGVELVVTVAVIVDLGVTGKRHDEGGAELGLGVHDHHHVGAAGADSFVAAERLRLFGCVDERAGVGTDDQVVGRRARLALR